MASGSSIKPWSLVSDPKAQAKNLAKQLNCPTDSSTDLVQCLRDTDASAILNVQLHALSVSLDFCDFYLKQWLIARRQCFCGT